VTRFEPNLRIPGPTPLPPSVREAGARQMLNHRGPEFAGLLGRIQDGMRPFFGTTGDIAILSSAGTGGLEAAIAVREVLEMYGTAAVAHFAVQASADPELRTRLRKLLDESG